MEISLISIHIKKSPLSMPLPTAVLKAALDSDEELKRTLHTTIMNFYLDQTPEYISEKILQYKPEAIGFSVYIWNYELVCKISNIIRNANSNSILFAGGAEATINSHNLLNSAPLDFIIKGEGEKVITQVARKIIKNENYRNAPGLVLKSGDKIIETEPSPPINLDEYPSPFLSNTINIKEYEGIVWELSRGCPFKCDFCFESKGFDIIRKYSLDRIRKELELFENCKVSQIFVLDPTFNADKERAKTILKMIQKIAPAIHFTFEVRAEFIDDETAKLFASINCSLQIGLQSSNPDIARLVNRKLDPNIFKRKIDLLNKWGVIFGLDVIYGLPKDSFAGFEKSLDFAINLQPNNVDIFRLSVFPGTTLYDKSSQYNLKFLGKPPYSVISTPEFIETNMSQADNLALACDIFYNRGGAVGWLFIILETLSMKPSRFFLEFYKFLSQKNSKLMINNEIFKNITNDYKMNDICDLQREFTELIFTKRGQKAILSPIIDFIKYNCALNSSLIAGSNTNNSAKIKIAGSSIFKLCAGTAFVTLNYPLDSLMNIGEVSLYDFVKLYKPNKDEIVVYNNNNEVSTLSIQNRWRKLLSFLDGKTSLEVILSKLNIKSKPEVVEFIKFALDENIIFEIK